MSYIRYGITLPTESAEVLKSYIQEAGLPPAFFSYLIEYEIDRTIKALSSVVHPEGECTITDFEEILGPEVMHDILYGRRIRNAKKRQKEA